MIHAALFICFHSCLVQMLLDSQWAYVLMNPSFAENIVSVKSIHFIHLTYQAS